MMTKLEVFADITCPFTHVGLAIIAARFAESDCPVECRVRAWPLQWINGEPLASDAVATKASVLRAELGISQFAGLDEATWPMTTIPALNLAALAYDSSPAVGMAVSLELRDALFEEGKDVSNPATLAEIAARHELRKPPIEPLQSVLDDYQEGLHRGVKGSPDFFVAGDEYFCPSLELGHNDAGGLTARFDADGLETFISKVISGS